MKPQKLQPKNGQLSIPANYFEQLHDWIDDLEKRLDQQSLRRQPDIAFRGSAISSGSGSSADYSGAFKIALSADGNYQVIDGRQPDSPYCGMALIGIYSWTVPKTALGPLQSGSIYVGWSAILKGMEVRTNSDAIYPQLEIGRFADGVLIQLYQGGDMVIPGWIYLS